MHCAVQLPSNPDAAVQLLLAASGRCLQTLLLAATLLPPGVPIEATAAHSALGGVPPACRHRRPSTDDAALILLATQPCLQTRTHRGDLVGECAPLPSPQQRDTLACTSASFALHRCPLLLCPLLNSFFAGAALPCHKLTGYSGAQTTAPIMEPVRSKRRLRVLPIASLIIGTIVACIVFARLPSSDGQVASTAELPPPGAVMAELAVPAVGVYLPMFSELSAETIAGCSSDVGRWQFMFRVTCRQRPGGCATRAC